MAAITGTITRVKKGQHEYDLSHRGLAQALIDAQTAATTATAAAVAAEDLVQGTQELIGGQLIPYFDSGETYHAYDMVLYRVPGEQDVHLYRALVDNGPGVWQSANWEQTSFYQFLVNQVRIETVRVRLQYTTNQNPISGQVVTCNYDGSSHTATTDANGYATFSIAFGTTYTLVFPSISGYVTPKNISHIANVNIRNVNIGYRVYTVGLSVIKDDGMEVQMSAWNPADNPHAVLLKLSTSAGNCAFQVLNVPAQNTKWASSNLLFPSLPQLGNATLAGADFDGVGNTNLIEQDWSVLVTSNPGLTIPATTTCRNTTVTISGTQYQGYLPSAGQLKAVKDNIFDINQALQTLQGNQIAINSGYWWSSSQYNGLYAWNLSNGQLDYNGKNYPCQVLPFFDF